MSKMKNSPPQNKPRKPVANSSTANPHKTRRNQRTGLGCSLAFVLMIVGLGLAVAMGGPRLLAFVDQTGVVTSPIEDHTSPAALAERRTGEMAQLSGYGWVDKAAGIAHIPINRALALVAESGLPVGGAAIANSNESTTGATADLSNVNYEDNVLPIFEQHCAECHGADDPEEGLQLTTYKGVMAGSIYGAVVKPGDPDNSYLVEMVVTGKMPKKGPDLAPAEIETIIAWIEAGAPERVQQRLTRQPTQPLISPMSAFSRMCCPFSWIAAQNVMAAMSRRKGWC